jgi:hypothetical protein
MPQDDHWLPGFNFNVEEWDANKVALPNIPHARRVYEEGRTLHVVTDLMHKSDSPGFDRKRHDQMMDAIVRVAGNTIYGDRYRPPYDSYVIHSPGQP